MNIIEHSVKKRTFVIYALALLLLGGVYAYKKLGKLEDPEFAVKTALVVTYYPGALPHEVEDQVTEVIEKAVQQIPELDEVKSLSKNGVSIVWVEIQEKYRADSLPQIWDMLRRKVHDAQTSLPPGAYPSVVRDDYGDVYGIFLAVTGQDYTPAELKGSAEILKRELLLVDEVSRVELWGVQDEAVFVEISKAKLGEFGVTPKQVLATLDSQNKIVKAGSVETDTERIPFTPSGTFRSVDEIGDLVIRGGGDLVRMRDVTEIRRGYKEPAAQMMRVNGTPAIGLAISIVSGGNVVRMGHAVKERLAELMPQLPPGMHIETVSFQADNVEESVNTFIINLIESVIIVIAILLLTMGLRSGMIIGSGLVLTILGTLLFMYIFGIDMQRTSLGALIIAMGMLVDNAIVVTEGGLIKLQRGMNRMRAVTTAASETAWPLLGATLVAILAFMPIGLSKTNTGEYCMSLFQVVGISLGLSWILSMTQTPVFCDLFLKVKNAGADVDLYAGNFYQLYKRILSICLHHRILVLLVMAVLLVGSSMSFKYVDKIFFPKAARAQFMIDYWLPENSRIERVSDDMSLIEQKLLSLPEVTTVTSCIGAGPARFYLPYSPEIPNSSYGQLIVNVKTAEDIDTMAPMMKTYLAKAFPQAEPRIRRFPLGPAKPFDVEARFSGPDPKVLRQLADKAEAIMRNTPGAISVRTDWRRPVKVLVPEYSQVRGRRALVSRQDVAGSLLWATDGRPVGYYRESINLIPIIIRAEQADRTDLDDFSGLPVWGSAKSPVPLEQVTEGIGVEWVDPMIRRHDRRRAISVQCDPEGMTADQLRAELIPAIEAISLPAGYDMVWGGVYEDSHKSQKEVANNLPLAVLLMSLIIVGLFNAFRQPFIIACIMPLSLIGVVWGLLLTGKPFGFMAMLGTLSLSGMLIKNAVVLLDQIELEKKTGLPPYTALMNASVSRMRPVLMASMTTVLGMLPLVADTLYGAMAVAIMFGLTFATILTLIVVPVLYTLLFRVRPE